VAGQPYFCCSDRDGNPIDCPESAWDHILDEHAIMEGCEHLVRDTLKDPDVHTVSPNQERECYYRHGLHPDAPNDFIKVVVAYRPFLDVRRGRVITAFPAERVGIAEKELWKK
jgi:hypothetical protein